MESKFDLIIKSWNDIFTKTTVPAYIKFDVEPSI